jgi:hypothetical protein
LEFEDGCIGGHPFLIIWLISPKLGITVDHKWRQLHASIVANLHFKI